MSIAFARSGSCAASLPAAQPNELDRMRLVRGLESRTRYRYVVPQVTARMLGYLVTAPCCSRNVDPDGGEIPIALLTWDVIAREWSLARRDHACAAWIEDSRYARLGELIMRLNADPAREFWP